MEEEEYSTKWKGGSVPREKGKRVRSKGVGLDINLGCNRWVGILWECTSLGV